ncbi:WYL domain-containing protein [Brevibacillus sp. DP1.3A]|uniref:WYL domain-containing protein n=1 Tax=Brevibacillus sp. DP1.3A TaxID=2738867 RepID=UPI00156B914D|nr:WYL domain-containing protein [Brevibacillus sp. DP1.3A]UED76554.1 WYL domain-containing protein [Brevibacillus sp. DP1.3A]
MIQELRRYAAQQQAVEIIYLKKDGEASRRTIRVVNIDGNKGSLKAYCYRRKAYRAFALDNILAIAPVSGHFAG